MVAVIAFLSISAVVDVVSSLGSIQGNGGTPKAQLDGQFAAGRFTVGHQIELTFGLYLASGGAMDPACIAANLTPEFQVLRVTFLGSPGSPWKNNESCGQILESHSTIPIVITAIPLHAGDYSLKALPKVKQRTVGSGPHGTVLVRAS